MVRNPKGKHRRRTVVVPAATAAFVAGLALTGQATTEPPTAATAHATAPVSTQAAPIPLPHPEPPKVNTATLDEYHRRIDSLAKAERSLKNRVNVLARQAGLLEARVSRAKARLSFLQRQAEAAAAKRAAARQRAATAPGRYTIADVKAYAKARVGAYQFQFLDLLWTKESGWNWRADNPTSDAYGIPQALPGSKMASAGADWATNPYTQVRWGLGYIADRYGTPLAAWNHSVANNWY